MMPVGLAFAAIALFLIIAALLMWLLVRQSKKPAGALGRAMMHTWNKTYLPLADWALQNLGDISPQHILDVGVGNGASSLLLAQRFAGATVQGIDYSVEAVKAAQQYVMEDRLGFLVQDVHKMSFEDGKFDLITAFQTHFHWQDLPAALRELRRVASKDGRVVLASEKNKLDIYTKQVATPTQMEALAKKCGFTGFQAYEKAQWICFVLDA
jgi:ubiquinone/menaquinone biosynthesis C-methylase UbiE